MGWTGQQRKQIWKHLHISKWWIIPGNGQWWLSGIVEPESTFTFWLIVKRILYSSSFNNTLVRLIWLIVEWQTNDIILNVCDDCHFKKCKISVPLFLTPEACESYMYTNLITLKKYILVSDLSKDIVFLNDQSIETRFISPILMW